MAYKEAQSGGESSGIAAISLQVAYVALAVFSIFNPVNPTNAAIVVGATMAIFVVLQTIVGMMAQRRPQLPKLRPYREDWDKPGSERKA